MSDTPTTDTDKGLLHIARVQVLNVMGIEDQTIDLETVTEIAGPNGSAKSSLRRAMLSALGRDASLATLQRVDENNRPVEGKAQVDVLILGADGYEMNVTRKGGGSPEVKLRQGETWLNVQRPTEFLQSIVDVSANPARWLQLSDEEKAKEVLEACTIEGYSRELALKAAELEDFQLPPIPAGQHPLDDLADVEKAIYDSRTVENAKGKTETEAARKLMKDRPAMAPADVAEEHRLAAAAVEQLATHISSREATIDGTEKKALEVAELNGAADVEKHAGVFKAAAAKLRADHEQRAATLRAGVETAIAEMAKALEEDVDAERVKGEKEIATAQELQKRNEQAARDEAALEREALAKKRQELEASRVRLATLEERKTHVESDRSVRKIADAAKAQAAKHAATSARYSKGLEGLKAYRLRLVEQLPIEGLAVKFDEKGRKTLTLDGTPLELVNTGRRVELAVEVAMLRARPANMGDDVPRLPIVFVDGAESLDDETRALMYRRLAAAKIQVVGARVASKREGYSVRYGAELMR